MLEFSQPRGRSLARKVKLGLGRINASHLVRRAPFNNQFSKSAVAATNINPFQTRRKGQPIDENRSDPSAPISHISLIREPVLKADLSVRHHPSFALP